MLQGSAFPLFSILRFVAMHRFSPIRACALSAGKFFWKKEFHAGLEATFILMTSTSMVTRFTIEPAGTPRSDPGRADLPCKI